MVRGRDLFSDRSHTKAYELVITMNYRGTTVFNPPLNRLFILYRESKKDL